MNSGTGKKDNKALIVILGPTAVGKTSVGVHLAKHYQTDVLSADSRQFYREMRIGTALPEPDELNGVRHHFLANLSIHDDFNVHAYERMAIEKLNEIYSNHDIALMVGGSGLYIDAVVHGIDELPDADLKIREQLKKEYSEKGLEPLRKKLESLDPEYYSVVDLNNPNRIMRALEVCLVTGKTFSSLRKNETKQRDFSIIKIGLNLPREELFQRIHSRIDHMIEKGLLDEVKKLYSFRELNALKTVGYSELYKHIDGKVELEDAIEKIKTNTRRYAKRQLTWFKRDKSIKWFSPDEIEEMIRYVDGG